MHYRRQVLGTVFTLILIVSSVTAWGHAAIVWAYVEKNMIHVEAFFPNGAKIQNATVFVIDEKGVTLLKGKTDTEGKFSYKPTIKKTQSIVIKAGESHVGDFELTDEDLAEISLQ